MPIKRLVVLAAAFGLVACAREIGTSPSGATEGLASFRPTSNGQRAVSVEEMNQIGQVLLRVPNAERTRTRTWLMSSSHIVDMSRDPIGQAHLDTLYGLRRAARVRPLANVAAQPVQPELRDVTLALVGELPVRGARAVVMRRSGNPAPDLILVSRETTGGDLRNAVVALIESRRKQVSIEKNSLIAVQAPKSAHSKQPHVLGEATGTPADVLQSMPSVVIPDVGRAKTLLLKVAAP